MLSRMMNRPLLPKTYIAAVSNHVGDYPTLQELATPSRESLAPGTALVRIAFAGVCHSDVALALGKGTHRPIEPVISGHEGTGHIVDLGLHIRSGPSPQIGDRVGIKFIADTCLTCEACLAGDEESCAYPKISGINEKGVFQQYVVASTLHLVPIPDEVPLEIAAPVLCAGLTTYKALLNANVGPGDWVVIPGAGGGLGHLAVQYAIAMNFRVVGVDTGRDKKQLLERYGMHRWVDFREEKDVNAAVIDAMGGQKAKAAIVTAGSIAPYKNALGYLGPRSTLVCVGLPKESKFEIDAVQLVLQSSRIVGSSVGSRAETQAALMYVALGKVKVEMELRPLSEIAEVYKELEAGRVSGRIVLDLRTSDA